MVADSTIELPLSRRQGLLASTTAADQHRRGALRIDPAYPWHFIWEGTGEHYFFNGTTAYWLVGWRDEPPIQYCIDRLARLKVNGNYCLAQPGNVYAIYLPHGGKVSVRLEPGAYQAQWFNATSGQRVPIVPDATGPAWTSSGSARLLRLG
jgi:hypothetical protein